MEENNYFSATLPPSLQTTRELVVKLRNGKMPGPHGIKAKLPQETPEALHKEIHGVVDKIVHHTNGRKQYRKGYKIYARRA